MTEARANTGIVEWILASALAGDTEIEILAGASERLCAAGCSLVRASVAFDLLDPTYDARGVRWLRDRHSGDAIEWNDPAGEAEVPSALFDSIAENLLQNALTKRQHEGGIEISVKLTVDRNSPMLTVRDTGQAIAASVADSLFRTPVQSAHGLGIGLYHAARQAGETGYRLDLAENRPGSVVFTLAPRT